MEHCPQRELNQVKQSTQAKGKEDVGRSSSGTPATTPASTYGEWMVAQEPRRGRRPIAKEGKSDNGRQRGDIYEKTKISTASRFAALIAEEGENMEGGVEILERRPLQNFSNRAEGQREENLEADRRKNWATMTRQGAMGTGRKSRNIGMVREEREGTKRDQKGVQEEQAGVQKVGKKVEKKQEKEVNKGSQLGLMEKERNGPNGMEKKETEVTWAKTRIDEDDKIMVEERNCELQDKMEEVVIGPEIKPPDLGTNSKELGHKEGEQRTQAQDDHEGNTNKQLREDLERRRDRSPERRFR